MKLLLIFFVINLLFVHLVTGQLQKCLNQFLTTDYHFISVKITYKAAKCISGGSQNKQEFKENCPEPHVFLTENFTLKIRSETLLEERRGRIFECFYTYDETPQRTEASKHAINVLEQLEIDSSGCIAKSSMPWEKIILQVLSLDKDRKEYGFLFFKQKKLPYSPDVLFLMGHVMVPYKTLRRSPVLNEIQYEKFRKTNLVYDERLINRLISGCDLVTLFKESCGLSENKPVDNGALDAFGIDTTLMSGLLCFVALIN